MFHYFDKENIKKITRASAGKIPGGRLVFDVLNERGLSADDDDRPEELGHERHAQGISQKELEALSGVSQPVIARMERGSTSPQIGTLMKVLRPLGLTMKIVPVADGLSGQC